MTEPILTKADIHAAWRESGAISSSPPDWALIFARGIESRCHATPDREAIIEEIAEAIDHMGEGRRLEEYVAAIREFSSKGEEK
jgi:hypothetical protein